MLLRSSRKAALLTKEAGAPAWVARQVGKAGLSQLQNVGRFVKEHPRLSLGIVGGTTAGVGTVAEGIRRSELGLNPAYQQAARMGYVPHTPPPPTTNLFAAPTRLAEQIERVRSLGSRRW